MSQSLGDNVGTVQAKLYHLVFQLIISDLNTVDAISQPGPQQYLRFCPGFGNNGSLSVVAR